MIDCCWLSALICVRQLDVYSAHRHKWQTALSCRHGMLQCNLSFHMTMFNFHVCHFNPYLNVQANAQTIINACTSHERIPDRLCVEKPPLEHNSLVLLRGVVPFVLSESANTSNLKLRCITCTCLGNNQNKTSAAYPPSHFLLLCFGVEIMPWCLCMRACRIWQ